MKIVKNIEEMKILAKKVGKRGLVVGLVPTMGYLHDGHLSLVRRAKKECGLVVMSVFVNEKQFGPKEDYKKYPRNIEGDIAIAKKAGVDVFFAPAPDDVYPDGYASYVSVEGRLTEVLCAKARPGHFKGVTTVVAKLFNIVSPSKAYFGQKDYQQALVIRKMVNDLNMGIDVKILPIFREKNGLAMSSRNVYLSREDRAVATRLNKAVKAGGDMLRSGDKPVKRVKEHVKNMIGRTRRVKIDYLEILDADGLGEVFFGTTKILIALAAYVGKTRLIDNVIVAKRTNKR